MTERLTRCADPMLLGTTVEIKYPKSKAVVDFGRDGMMRWAVTGSNGDIDVGSYRVSIVQMSSTMYLVNWMEKTGSHVSQVFDFLKGEVMTAWGAGNGAPSTFIKGFVRLNPKQH